MKIFKQLLTTAAFIGDVWPLNTLLTFPVFESYARAVKSPEHVITKQNNRSCSYQNDLIFKLSPECSMF